MKAPELEIIDGIPTQRVSSEAAREIIEYEVTAQTTVAEMFEFFYSVCRKHGIAQGTKTEGGGVLVANFEWTMLETLFMRSIINAVEHMSFFVPVPDDLKAYD